MTIGNGKGPKDLRPKALIAWSSGKDSAWALHLARLAGDYDIVGALTTVTETFGRVSIHGVREELLMAQLKAAGLPPTIVRIPYPCTNEIYEERMAEAMRAAIAAGVTHVIFGKLPARSTLNFHSSPTSFFPETTKTTLAPISSAQHNDVNDLPNRITANINRFVRPAATAFEKLSTTRF